MNDRGDEAVRGALAGTARSTATDEDLFSTGETWESARGPCCSICTCRNDGRQSSDD